MCLLLTFENRLQCKLATTSSMAKVLAILENRVNWVGKAVRILYNVIHGFLHQKAHLRFENSFRNLALHQMSTTAAVIMFACTRGAM